MKTFITIELTVYDATKDNLKKYESDINKFIDEERTRKIDKRNICEFSDILHLDVMCVCDDGINHRSISKGDKISFLKDYTLIVGSVKHYCNGERYIRVHNGEEFFALDNVDELLIFCNRNNFMITFLEHTGH